MNDKNTNKVNFLPWIILLLASLGLFYFLQKGYNPATPETNPGNSASVMDTAKKDVPGTTSPSGSRSMAIQLPPDDPNAKIYILPNSVKVKGVPDSFISKLVEYMKGNEPAGKCFTLDNVAYQPGTSNLTPKSDVQMMNIWYVLGAYPGMTIHIKTYPDKKDNLEDLKSAHAKASSIKQWLFLRGIEAERLQSDSSLDGKTNSSDPGHQGMESNSRIDICVLKKD